MDYLNDLKHSIIFLRNKMEQAYIKEKNYADGNLYYKLLVQKEIEFDKLEKKLSKVKK